MGPMSIRPTIAAPAIHRVAVVVLERTLVLDLAVALQCFGRRPSVWAAIRDEEAPPYELVVCGRAPRARTTMGFTMEALAPDSAIEAADTVIVPGLDFPQRPHEPAVLEAIRAASARGARLVSLCAGVFVLGQAGALAGHRVTTHWGLADDLRQAFPDVEVCEEELFIDDGQVLSSGGMLAGADLCLHVLCRDQGQAYANDVSRLLVSPPHRSGGQLQYALPRRRPATGSLAALLTWMQQHLDLDLTLESVAEQAHLSPRTLARRFRAELGDSVAGWVATRRVERARELLETTTMPVTEVAFVCGFGSVASFRRQFSTRSGASPRAYRETFRGATA